MSASIGPISDEYGDCFYDILNMYDGDGKRRLRAALEKSETKVGVHDGLVLLMSSCKQHGGYAEERLAQCSRNKEQRFRASCRRGVAEMLALRQMI